MKYTETLDALITHQKKRLKHAQRRLGAMIEREQGRNVMTDLTYHAGWEKGYWEGKATALEDSIDNLTELRENLKKQEREF